MRIALIAAMSENGVIGNHNALPWHFPEELKYFREKTRDKPVIMGRKTFESIGNKPLPNRLNIILTHALHFTAPDCKVVHSVEDALKAAGDYCEEIMVMGGAEIYKAFLPVASRIYLTVIHQIYAGDTVFPIVDWHTWKILSEEKRDGFTLKVFDKI
ncbi:MAG: dihydrofolate reductase [Gammaproteobacteria bacterium]|nr:dihydrofolate reductase [Gammaproteobacteria bacterium]